MFKFKSNEDYNIFLKRLEKAGESYDDTEKMTTQTTGPHGYHTKLRNSKVHPTRESLSYAVSLFDSGIPENISRGKEIVRKVIFLQDQNPESITYGIWSWYYEEPLEEMDKPDWNWADFCGKELLQLCLYHMELLEPDLFELIKESVYHACESIIRRNVGMGYTNIAIMGTYVTHVAGELLGFSDILEYAKKRVVRFYNHVMITKGFSEYNSPTYTRVAVDDLAKMRHDIKCEASLSLIGELYDIAWSQIANHWHVPTGEWAGPHSRSYRNFLDNGTRAFLQYAMDGKIKFFYNDANDSQYKESLPASIFRIDPKCPDKYLSYFYESRGEIEINEAQSVDSLGNKVNFAYTYMTEHYAIGTFPSGDFWNQRRNQIAYFGQKENPIAWQVKFLHDMYDYCSALVHNSHRKNKILSLVNFCTDGGDTHGSLDKVKDATIRASDMRLRFEITAKKDIAFVNIPDIFENPLVFDICGTPCKLEIPYAKFGNEEIKYEITRDENSIFIDVILYSGNEKSIDFKQIDEAVCAYSLTIGDSFNNFHESTLALNKDSMLTISGDGMSVSSLLKPSVSKEIYGNTEISVPVY